MPLGWVAQPGQGSVPIGVRPVAQFQKDLIVGRDHDNQKNVQRSDANSNFMMQDIGFAFLASSITQKGTHSNLFKKKICFEQ